MAATKKPAKAKTKATPKTGKTHKAVKPVAAKPAAKKAALAKKPVPVKTAAPAKRPVGAKKPAASKQPAAVKKLIAPAKKAAAPVKAPAPARPAPAAKAATAKAAVAKLVAAPPAAVKSAATRRATTAPAPAAPALVKSKAPAPARKPIRTLQRPEVPEIIPPEPVVGSDYMNPAQRQFYRKLLLSQRGELTAELEQTIHHMQDENVNLPDPNDRASQEADMTLELRSRDRETKLIHKIDEAIARLEAGEYGFCESCNEPIGRGRLEARPTATLCIDCKRLDEIRERQVA